MSAPQQKRRVSLQVKVLLPVLTMLVLLLGGTMWLVNRHIQGEFRADAARSLATAEAVFKNSQQIRTKNLLLRFRTVPNEPRFKAVSQLGDPATFQVLLTELLDELGADAAMFTTQEGKVLASATRRPAFKWQEFESSSEASIQQAVLDGLPNADLIDVGGHFYAAVSIPSSIGGHLAGVVTFGVEMGESIAHEFKQLTHAEVIFVAKDRIAASTLIVALPPVSELTGALAKPAGSSRVGPDSIRAIVVGGEHFFGTAGELPALGNVRNHGYILLSSCEQHLSVLHLTQSWIGLIGLLAIGLSTVFLWAVIRSAMLPLRKLRAAAERLGHGDYSCRVAVTSGDECGELATVFNQMTENLNTSRRQLQQAHDGLELRVEERTTELREEIRRREQAQKEAQEAHVRLVDASRMAGMAQVATGVLHNVGNVLNSVNVSATLVMDQVRKSKTASLAKAVQLLREHKDDVGEFLTNDPKGKQLPAFFEALSEKLTREQAALTTETQSLQQNIEHIKQIVAMQQSFAKVSGARENLQPHELVEDALRISSGALARHHIEVVREFEAVPPVLVDRHLVLQILVNLVSNAKDALDHRNYGRRLILRVKSVDNRVRMEVTDNGAGIAPENHTRIFQHGFTTKKTGHGFGLHSGANAAKEMGGSLTMQSDGPGAGATFILELPISANSGQQSAPPADESQGHVKRAA